jgi:hypothetical protein
MKPRPLFGVAVLLGVLMAANGCVRADGLPGASNSLPTASATLHWATIDLQRGSYCWNSGGHGECADSPGADQLLKSGYLKPYRTAGGFDVKVTFHSGAQPNRFDVQLIHSPDGKFWTVNTRGLDTFNVGMSPPAKAGLYVYTVTGNWAEGDVGFLLALDLIAGAA